VWNGSSWASLGGPGSGLSDRVNAFAWSALGGGLDDGAYALAYDGGFDLFVGGFFDAAGDKPSAQIGCYRGAVPAGLIFADGFESGDLNAWGP
jgi:hypothetical protein